MRTKGVRSPVPTVPARGPATVGALAIVALLLAATAAALPYRAFLTLPDPVAVAAGLAVAGCGLLLLREQATGPAGWLVYAAGLAWFLPALDVTGVHALDIAIRCTAFLHVALLAHGVVVVGARRGSGLLGRVTVPAAYVVALTPVVGGYRVALPFLGALLVVCVLATGGALPPMTRRWRAAAGLLLGLGLLLDALLRWRSEGTAESVIALAHPLELATVAVLVAIAGTRPSPLRAIEVRLDGTDTLSGVLAHQLGVAQVSVALTDGEGGWLRPSGERRPPPASGSSTVLDAGSAVAVLEGDVGTTLPEPIEHVLRLAAANARLRRSFGRHVEDLEGSRRRLLAAADDERAALGSALRAGTLRHVSDVESELRRRPSLHLVVPRAEATRRELEAISRGIDPVTTAGSLTGAFRDLAASSACRVQALVCDEPRSRDVATALWFCAAEAVVNTTKHAPGAIATVRIERHDDDRIRATFSDNGPGGADRTGRGLLGIADRVEGLGGSFTLHSPPGAGTTLTLDLPDEGCGQPQQALPVSADLQRERRTYRRDDRHPGGTS